MRTPHKSLSNNHKKAKTKLVQPREFTTCWETAQSERLSRHRAKSWTRNLQNQLSRDLL